MSWGNKLLFAFMVFASGMGYLVYRSTYVTYELVEKEYYKTELQYQQVIDATNRVNQLKTGVELQQNTEGLLLQLPQEMHKKEISGSIWFYCAYDQTKDKKIPLHILSDGTQQFSAHLLETGNYIAKINWTLDGKNYFAQKNITIRR